MITVSRSAPLSPTGISPLSPTGIAKGASPIAAILACLVILAGVATANAPLAVAQQGNGQDAPDLLLEDNDSDSPGQNGSKSKPADKLDLDKHGQLRSAPDTETDENRKRLQLRALLRRRPGQNIPDDPAERDKLLAKLYGFLATSTSKPVSDRLVKVIQRVWSHSSSDTVTLLMRRATVAEKKKQEAKALKFLTYVTKMAPAFTEVWNQRAFIYYQQRDYRRALGDLRRALALDPNHFKALAGLGRILLTLDEKRAAQDVYNKLIKVYPLSEVARQALRKLNREFQGQPI